MTSLKILFQKFKSTIVVLVLIIYSACSDRAAQETAQELGAADFDKSLPEIELEDIKPALQGNDFTIQVKKYALHERDHALTIIETELNRIDSRILTLIDSLKQNSKTNNDGVITPKENQAIDVLLSKRRDLRVQRNSLKAADEADWVKSLELFTDAYETLEQTINASEAQFEDLVLKNS